jgi:hypothetical protein
MPLLRRAGVPITVRIRRRDVRHRVRLVRGSRRRRRSLFRSDLRLLLNLVLLLFRLLLFRVRREPDHRDGTRRHPPPGGQRPDFLRQEIRHQK